MKRRPLCILFLLVAAAFAVLNQFGIPLVPEFPGNRIADERIASEEETFDPENRSGYNAAVIGTVRVSEEKEEYTECILEKAYLAEGSKRYRIGDVRLYLKNPKVYKIGCEIRASGQLCRVPKASDPGQFDSELYYKIRGIRYIQKKSSVQILNPSYSHFREFLSRFRQRLRRRIAAVFPKEEAGILAAMLIGDKSMIESESRIRWQTAGVVHMLAISGLHLTILGMGLYKLLKRLFLPDSVAIPVSCLTLLLYSVFTGLAVSTVRAFLMFALLVCARLFGRTYDPPTALSFAGILILLENPYYLFYSGFQLSFSAVFFCILFGRRSKFMMSLMLTVGMLPFILHSFYEIPLYSVPVNLIAVPVLPVLLGTGMLGTIFGGAAAVPAEMLLRILNRFFDAVRNFPFASVIVGKPDLCCILLFYILFAVWAYFLKKYKAYKRKVFYLLMTPVLILLLGIHPEKKLRMTFLDVGQGDSCLIETPMRKNILVDGGSTTVQNVGTYRILPAIKAEGVRRLDYLIVTHMDEDHISGIREILEAVSQRNTSLKVKTVVLPYLKERGEAYRKMERLAKKAGARVLYVSDGDRIGIDRCSLDILNPDPQNEESPVDENGQCIVFHFRYRSFDALFTGDVSGEGEENVRKEWENEQKRQGTETVCEVLKVSHHGSQYSTPEEFLKEVAPRFSIISVGEGNRYGHPSPELLERLAASKTKIFRTDQDGAVTVDTDGRTFRIKAYSLP